MAGRCAAAGKHRANAPSLVGVQVDGRIRRKAPGPRRFCFHRIVHCVLHSPTQGSEGCLVFSCIPGRAVQFT